MGAYVDGCVLGIVFPTCVNGFVLTSLTLPSLPATLPLLIRGGDTRKYTDPWMDSEELCLHHR